MTHTLTTPRLKLRHLRPADAPRVQALCGNLNVARWLRRVPHPYPDGLAEDWIATRQAAWRDGGDADGVYTVLHLANVNGSVAVP